MMCDGTAGYQGCRNPCLRRTGALSASVPWGRTDAACTTRRFRYGIRDAYNAAPFAPGMHHSPCGEHGQTMRFRSGGQGVKRSRDTTTGEPCLSFPPHGGTGRDSGMVVKLENGGTVTVTDSGTVEYRRGRERNWIPGRGSYAETVEWLSSLTNGSAGVLFTSRKA